MVGFGPGARRPARAVAVRGNAHSVISLMMPPIALPLASLLRLTQPGWLLAAAAAAGPVLLAARARRRGRHLPVGNVALQCAAVLAAAAALAGPSAPLGGGGRRPVLVLRDVSASCRGQGAAGPVLPEGLPVERYDFAAGVRPAGVPGDANATELGPALRLALARRAGLSGLIVRTDGRFTDVDWRAAAALLGPSGLPVAIVPLDAPPADARVAALSARRLADGAVDVRVTAAANALVRRTLRLTRVRPQPSATLLARPLDLLPGRSASVRATDRPPADHLAVYHAELAGQDRFPENDHAEAVVLPARQGVAVVGPAPMAPSALADTLGLAGESLAPTRAPSRAEDWAAYAAVLLADATGTLLPPSARAALGRYVQGGGGLVLLGAGPHASAADHEDPLNRAAALVANPYQRRPLQLTVVLDASGSMAERTAPAGPADGRIKFDRAVEAVASLRRHLTPADRLRVIAFSDAARELYDSGAGSIDFPAVRDALRAVRPAGPTDVAKALDLAVSAPPDEGRDAMVLVVSDLRTRRFRPDRVAETFRAAGLSLAVVALAGGAATQAGEPPLETLARLLGARVVRRDSLTGLAAVFGDLLRQRRGNALRTGRFPTTAPGPVFSLPADALPDVSAYLLSAPQPGADVLAHVGTEGDPLLAVQRVGLGRSVTLALPPSPKDNPAWDRAGAMARLLPAAIRWALRPGGDPRFVGTVQPTREGARLRIDARDANGPMNLLTLAGRAVCPTLGGEPRAFALAQVAPGRYEVRLPGLHAPSHVEVSAPDGRIVWQAPLPRVAPPELAAIGPDWANLRALAHLTGGRIATGAYAADFAIGLDERRRTPLWPALLALAAALMLIEWASARIWQKRP